MAIPYQNFGKQDGQPLLFAHANGFPPTTYTALLSELGQNYRIIAPHLRPLWQDIAEFRDGARDHVAMHRMAKDQNEFIEEHQLGPVTYIGHSMGANIGILAAQLKPHLYRQIILIEPVFLRKTFARILRFCPRALINKVPIVAKALSRPDRWDNAQQAYDFHRPKRVFSKLSDEVLGHYIEAAVVADGSQVKLAYGKHWEALVYGSMPNIWPYLKRCKVPLSVIRGEFSDTVDDLAWKRWQAIRPAAQLPEHARAINITGSGHLLPLEQPQVVAQQITNCLLHPQTSID